MRVVVKLAEAARPLLRAFQAGDEAPLRDLLPDARFVPFFAGETPPRAGLRAPFDRYLAVEAPDRAAADAIVERLRAHSLVEDVYVEGGPTPPPNINPADDPRSANQGYLGAAPVGIDAIWTWPNSTGEGIRFVDLEQGWTLDHEDLAAAGIGIISGVNQDFHGHGTAVLGQVLSVDNQLGGIGIAPRAIGRVVSQWRTSTSYSTAAAILSAADAMSPGDVLLLEAQTSLGGLDDLPVEVETAVFDAIRAATDDGIVVIEAAGNGGHDLDTWQTAAGRRRLNRGHADFRDSGAIMVGAASSTVPHARLDFSCHGSRIDCYGWGENIDTAGDGFRGRSRTEYTAGFGGASGASPVVAGAAVLLQAWRRRRHGRVFEPETVRALLSDPALNTLSANPAIDRIGVMPDLRAIIERQIANERFRPVVDNYVSSVYILFGLIDDSPGVIWVPGRGPVPVDPDWRFAVRSIAAPKRDLLAALAASEIADRISDAETRAKLNDAAADAMRAAIERIAPANRAAGAVAAPAAGTNEPGDAPSAPTR